MVSTNTYQAQANELSQKLWAIANELRGQMDASEFKNYILGVIFYRYLSERTEMYMAEILKNDGVTYEEAFKDDEYRPVVEEWSLSKLGYVIKPENLFRNLIRKITKFDNDADKFSVEDFEKAIKENTKAIVCTHGSNLTGNKVDVERIGEIAQKHGLLFVVDASQTAGVFPIDVQKMHIDILCFTGHKGLLGPQGTGGMYVRKGVHVRPLLSGGTGVQTYSKTQPEEMPTALEAGTLNGHGIAGLDAAIGYLEETGIDTIRAKEQALMKRFYEGVKEIPGVKIYGDFSSMDRCAVVSLNIRDYDSGEVSDALLTDYGISTRSGGHCAPRMHEALGTVEQGAVRFSFSHYNTEEEVDTAIRAVCELAEEE